MKKKVFFFIVVITLFLISLTSIYAASTLASSSVYYDKSTSGSTKTNVQDAIDDLYTKTKYISFKVGDYVKMTPAKTSFKIPKTLTGYTSDQTINPSELTLWRVIRINSDSTVDMVAVNISSSKVYFTGLNGYLNLIGTLNYIAQQYENPKYTIGSRHTGYINQTEYITNTSKFTYPPSLTATTSNTNNESVGGGDWLYTTDVDLIRSTFGYVQAAIVNGSASNYWLASRVYVYHSTTSYAWNSFDIASTGSIENSCIYKYLNGFVSCDYGNHIRPIVTLGTNIRGTGSGTSASPYVLS